MRHEHGYVPQRLSRRDVAAVWLCCAAAAVVAALVIAAANADASRRETYRGVYLPGRDLVTTPDRRDDDQDDATEPAEVPVRSLPPPELCVAQENPRSAAAAPPHHTLSPVKC